AITYLVGFALFTLAYALLSPPPAVALAAGLVGGLLSLALLRSHGPSAPRGRPYALAVGLALTQAGGGLAYWSVPPLVGGALLLLLFYVLSGVAEALLAGTLDRRVAVEYRVVTLIGMALVLSNPAWHGWASTGAPGRWR